MVILRQERVFSYAGRKKFLECWMIITYDTSGPSIQLYKDQSAKKTVFEKLHVPSLASQIRFGRTSRPYGNLPEIKADGKIDEDCFMAFQVEKRVKKSIQPHILWLCAESSKQMFGIMKILACGLTIMGFPAPAKNPNANDVNALHHYRPRIFQPANAWEGFWDDPPEAHLISPMELTKHVAKSMNALNAPSQGKELPFPADTVVKSKSTPDLETLVTRRRHSSVSCSTKSTSSRSSKSHSLSSHRRSKTPKICTLDYMPDLTKMSYSPQKTHKYERKESARSSPIAVRQREQHHKRIPASDPSFEEEEPIYIKQTAEAPMQQQERPRKTKRPAPQIVHHYDQPPKQDRPQHIWEHFEMDQPHRRYSYSVKQPSSPFPPQSILKRQLPRQCTLDERIPSQVQRPVSGYSSSTYASGHATPTHLVEHPQNKKFEVELLRRMSDLSLHSLSRTFSSQLIAPSCCEKPTALRVTEPCCHDCCRPLLHEEGQQPVEYEHVIKPKATPLLKQDTISLQEKHQIPNLECSAEPRTKRRLQRHSLYMSQGVQTDHDLPDPSIPLIDNHDFAQIKRFTIESHKPYLHHYRKISDSSRSIYIQRTDDTSNYEAVRPFFRNDSSSYISASSYDEDHSVQLSEKHSSNPVLIESSPVVRTCIADANHTSSVL